MPNKIFSDVADYLVEGAKSSGYLKGGKGSYGDGKVNPSAVAWGNHDSDTSSWFEGKQGSKGRGEAS